MASGNSAIRGSRVGSGPMGEQDRGFHADRVAVSYWDAQGNETVRYFAANLPDEEIPDVIDSPSTGLPAGRDKENPPAVSKLEPYKHPRSVYLVESLPQTHLGKTDRAALKAMAGPGSA